MSERSKRKLCFLDLKKQTTTLYFSSDNILLLPIWTRYMNRMLFLTCSLREIIKAHLDLAKIKVVFVVCLFFLNLEGTEVKYFKL